jgi:hypothetical protein
MESEEKKRWSERERERVLERGLGMWERVAGERRV